MGGEHAEDMFETVLFLSLMGLNEEWRKWSKKRF